jgi:hypothetical protein
MRGQLRLWDIPAVNLTAKIKAEREAGLDVFYHFRGEPLTMQSSRKVSSD